MGSKEITIEEYFKRYSEVEMVFNYYYKYCFSFDGKTREGDSITIQIGSDSELIYNLEVTDKPIKLKDLKEYFDREINYISAFDKYNNKLLELN